jgi:hypothetical protein
MPWPRPPPIPRLISGWCFLIAMNTWFGVISFSSATNPIVLVLSLTV